MLCKLILTVCLFTAAACIDPLGTESAEGLVVRAGTSFGMCIGYCQTELSITADEIVYTESSREPGQYPTRTRRMAITPAEWADISSLGQPSDFDGLEEVYGCPDCADGGAEWIEVEQDGTRRRVTFEYGASIGRIQRLIDRIRELRAQFPR